MRRHWDYVTFASLCTLLIAIMVLVGWGLDIRTLKSVFPGYITMKVNTAIGLGFLATALLAMRSESKHRRTLITGLSVTVIILATATLIEYLAGVNLRIDELFVVDVDGSGGRFPPGRLAPITALNFIFLSWSFLADGDERRRPILSQLLAALVLFASFQSLIGYAIGLSYLFGSAFYTQMAVHTSMGFVLLATGKLVASRDQGIVKSFTANSPIARMMRWMLLSAALVPPFVRWTAQFGLRYGIYDQDFSQLIQVVGITGLMAIILVTAGSEMFRAEAENLERQRALSESEQKFRALVDTTAQIVWTSNHLGVTIDDSPSWRHYTGQSLAEGRNGGWLNAIHPEDRPLALRAWQEASRTGHAYSVEYRVRHESGLWRWTLARGTPVLNEEGQVREWIGMNSDIHERKLIEIALKAAKEDAERANQLKSAFLANMSHEIRTPLGTMLGFADLSRDPQMAPEERRNNLDVIIRNGEQLSVIINDILDLSKVEAGHLSLEYKAVDPRAIVAEVMSQMRAKAAEKHLEFNFLPDAATPEKIVTDAVRLKQILVNLVSNAIKFTEKGHITLRSHFWRASPDRQGVNFTVEDSGIGIPAKQFSEVFDVFVQADGSLTRRFGGTGLGLALSRRLARSLGGDISLLSSAEGVGSTFQVHVRDQAVTGENKITEEVRTSVPALHGVRILVVDDAADNQQLIMRQLLKRGATVDAVENGLLGYLRALRDEYDVILMDLQMPVMDGYTATQKLREAGYTKPVIALTAHAMSEVRGKCLDAGCTDYLPKPIDFAELTQAIIRCRKAS